MKKQSADDRLAIHGGRPARQRPSPPMYPGGNLIDEEEEQSVLETLRARRLFRYYGPNPGPSKVEQLEIEFARRVGTSRALAVTSGSAALICGLRGIGVGPGDEVILPAYTWIASAAAVLAVGAAPVMAEIDETFTIDPADIERKITPYTRAVMPVHMRGVPCQMDEIQAVARGHNLKIIEDAAQSDGASHHGRQAGSIGDVGCFSLQFNKILTSGEGGMLVTSDDAAWKRALMYHDVAGGARNGIPADEIIWGINFRMPELLAAVMLVQLRRLDGLLAAMRERKRMLLDGLADVAHRKGVRFQAIPDPDGDACVACILILPDSQAAGRVSQALQAENISASVLYRPDRSDYHIYAHWTPILQQRTWSEGDGPWRWAKREIQYSREMCPRSLDLLGRAVHLDVNPLDSNSDIEETVDGIQRVIETLL